MEMEDYIDRDIAEWILDQLVLELESDDDLGLLSDDDLETLE